MHKILSDQYVTNDEINNLIKSNKNNGQTNKIEKGRQKNRVKGKGKIQPNKKVSYKKKRVYKSKALKNTIGKKVKYVESQNPEIINTKKAYRR